MRIAYFVKARDFIKPNEKVVVIFTEGKHFVLHDDNTGSTGQWKIDPNREVDRIILYHRDDENNANNLYIANHAGAEPADREGRYDIRLTHVQYIG
ncbi:MAG: HNH endonuclease, partial [Microcystis panniformis]